MATLEEIESLGFVRVGNWKLCPARMERGGVDCIAQFRGDMEPCVYIIVSEANGDSEVLYVGMGSNGWWRRVRKHLGNWDRQFHRLIEERLRSGAEVCTYSKTAEWVTMHGQRTNLCGAEEMALIARYQPKLNASKDVKRASEWQRD